MKFWTTTILLVAALMTRAQTTDKARFGISAGWQQYIFSDKLTSPLLYEANTLSLDGFLRKKGEKFEFFAGVNLQVGSNQPQQMGARQVSFSGVPDVNGEAEVTEARLNPFISWFSFKGQASLSKAIGNNQALGLAFTGEHVISGMAADDWYYTQVDLAPTYQYRYNIWELSLVGTAKLPLLAWVVRPNYAIDPSLPDTENYWVGFVKTSSQITSIHQLFNPQVDFQILWNRPRKTPIGIGYGLAWRSYSEPRPLRMALNHLKVILHLN